MKYTEYTNTLNKADFKDLNGKQIIQFIIEEYNNVRIDDTNIEAEGDMILIQWYENKFDITRQLIFQKHNEEYDEEYDEINQIGIVLNYDYDFDSQKAEKKNFWVHNPNTLKTDDILKQIPAEFIEILQIIPNSIKITACIV